MPSRPKSVIIDGIHYAPVDVTDASALSAEMRGKRALRLQAEVTRLQAEVERLRDRVQELTDAIGFHRLSVKPENATPTDEGLWEMLE